MIDSGRKGTRVSIEAATSENAALFGPFRLGLKAGELQRDGRRIRLAEQPFQILIMLLGRPGSVVSREEIRQKLWPNDTVVEFDHSINTAIRKLRLALGDSAETPQYIETVGRRGYRLLVAVEWVKGPAPGDGDDLKVEPERSAGANLIGRRLSHYRVLELLGGG